MPTQAVHLPRRTAHAAKSVAFSHPDPGTPKRHVTLISAGERQPLFVAPGGQDANSTPSS